MNAGDLVPFDRSVWRRFASPVGPDAMATLPPSISRDEIADVYAPLAGMLAERAEIRTGTGPYVIGVTGGIAVGKSTIASALAALLASTPYSRRTVLVSTDGFLLPNAELDARGLTSRKGFPDSYDQSALASFATDVRAGRATAVPVYSHRTYDVLTGEHTVVADEDIVVLEGLVTLQDAPDGSSGLTDLVDFAVYVDASEAQMVEWFLARIQALRVAAADDPTSFFRLIADYTPEQTEAMALQLWDATNGPNLRDHVAPTRDRADIVLVKGSGHTVQQVLVRPRQRRRSPG